jgi:stage II sporulation protein P
MSAINNFAWQLKANADKKYPGLIKGIFYGKGNYNQDLYPRTILVEAGTYTNSRYRAQDGANILADVIATTLYGEDYEKKITPKGKAITQVKGENKSATKTILWIFAIAIVGGGAFLVMSMGGFKEFSSKIKRFTGSDYTSFLHQKKDKKQDNEDSEDSEEK